ALAHVPDAVPPRSRSSWPDVARDGALVKGLLRKPLGFAVPLLFAPAACVAVLGIEPLDKDLRIGKCGAVQYFSVDCAECMDAACCDEVDACASDAACAPAARCTAACDPHDAACRIACGTAYATPATALGALESCRRASCIDACVEPEASLDARGAECVACA